MSLDELEELLLIISYKDDDELGAKDAFNSLYRSYVPFVSAVLKNALKEMGIYDDDLNITVVNNVFYKIYENPFSFQIPENAKNDNCFKGWLSKVSRNEVMSQMKGFYQNENKLTLVPNIEDFESASIEEEIYDGVNSKLLEQALSSLKERDKNILMTLYLYYEKGKNTPTYILDELCKIHGTTKPNIRKIRERCENKIIEYVEKHSNLKAIKNVR